MRMHPTSIIDLFIEIKITKKNSKSYFMYLVYTNDNVECIKPNLIKFTSKANINY